jgi:glutamine cyclotransferase
MHVDFSLFCNLYGSFQKCQYARTRLIKTEGRGWGLLADENIMVTELYFMFLIFLNKLKFEISKLNFITLVGRPVYYLE